MNVDVIIYDQNTELYKGKAALNYNNAMTTVTSMAFKSIRTNNQRVQRLIAKDMILDQCNQWHLRVLKNLLQMQQSNKRICKYQECKTRGSFCLTGSKEMYCKQHKSEQMKAHQVNVCSYQDCNKQSKFTENALRYCKGHLPGIGQTESSYKLCQHHDCNKRPSFGFELSKPQFCAEHKQNQMIDVVNPRCKQEDCLLRSGKDGFCLSHRKSIVIMKKSQTKKAEIVKKKANLCQFEDCQVRGSYTENGESGKPMFCQLHKTDIMKRQYNSLCKSQGCETRASFNYQHEKQALYCVLHKEDDMINLMPRYCQSQDCKTRANFNFAQVDNALYCQYHKQEGMVNVNDRICEVENCRTRPVYNILGEKSGIRCLRHRTYEMVNVKDTKCLNCNILARYNGLCSTCFYQANPDNILTRQFKTKEKAMSSYIQSQFNMQFVIDKPMLGAISKYRPDIHVQLTDRVIIIDCDETNHRHYDKRQEQARTDQLLIDAQGKPVIMIRFNPDSYVNGCVKVKSPWVYQDRNNTGLADPQEWQTRLESLRVAIKSAIDQFIQEPITFIYLYSDI